MHLCHPMMNPTHHYIINKESISSKNRRKPVIKTSKVWRINENSLPLPSKNGTDAFLMPSGIHFSVKNQQKRIHRYIRPQGKMPEWSIGAVSKTVVPLRAPRVRIPVFPQRASHKISDWLFFEPYFFVLI